MLGRVAGDYDVIGVYAQLAFLMAINFCCRARLRGATVCLDAT